MNKSLRIFLAVLALIAVSFSVLYYFNLIPFLNKTKKTEVNLSETPTTQATPNSSTLTPSSCIILEEQYCNQGEMVYVNKEPFGIGFRLPIDAKIYVPFKSRIEDEKELKIMEINKEFYSAAVLLDLSGGGGGDKNFFVALGYPKIENKNDILEKGDFLASAGKVKVDNAIGDYNLVLTFRSFGKTGQWQTDVDLLKQFFPNTQK